MIFVPAVDLGDRVQKGDVLGHGRFIDRIGVASRVYTAPNDGWMLCFGGQGLSRRGDVIAVVAEDVD
jgi:predicted deacylase